MNDTLATLNWLVETGADEAIADQPVNRLTARASIPSPLAGEGNSSRDSVKSWEGGTAKTPPPCRVAARPPQGALDRAPALRAPQGEGEMDAIGSAQATAGAATSLAELKAAMEAFDGCALKRTATNTVFADGVAEGRVMLIGESPGRDEDRIGRPFVGKAGQLLDKMLASIGLDRNVNAYITNVINWHPPNNRDPSPEEAAACLPFLRRHIELARPRLIILVGAVAARHVVGGTDGIMKLRGRWMEYRVGDQMVPLMPTLHPAYLLRQPAHKKLAWRDLQAVRDRMAALGLPEQS